MTLVCWTLYGSLQILGTTVASVAVSFFVDTTGMVLALTYLAVSVVGFLGYRKLVNPQPEP